MQISNIPLKWTVAFAAGDAGRVEVPATTADPTRASLTLGFPPLTMQPPETGGVPPQGEDFNGAMNQVARITLWKMAGGQFPYDSAFATAPAVSGYPQGANVAAADFSGTWLSLVDNNTADPDNVGTGWAPLSTYGVTALTGQTGGTVMLTPAQAMKRVVTVAGTLTSNLTLVVPAWTYDWTVTNATTGAFTVTVKPAAGAGVLIPQNGSPTPVRGDGTNVTQPALNVAPAGGALQSVQLQQVGSGQCRLSVVSAASLTLKPCNGNVVTVNGLPLLLPSAGVTVTNAGLTAATLYYVYLTGTTAAPVLVLSTTGHSTAPSGVETKTGDTTQSLVGMIATNASAQFVNTNAQRFCINWFNRRSIVSGISGGPFNTSSSSAAEVSTSIRLNFICWADEASRIQYQGGVSNTGAGGHNSTYVLPQFDLSIGAGNFSVQSPFGGYGGGFSVEVNATLSEGIHFGALLYGTNGDGTSTLNTNGFLTMRG